jgi:hypothetical protein
MKALKKPSRRSLAYLAFFPVCVALFMLLLWQDKSPDKKIVGKWREVSWEYEKVNRATDHLPDRTIHEHVRNELAQDLIIHRAETWEFLPDGKLLLHKGDGSTVRLNWKLKGRGHILKLNYANRKTEYYDLNELSQEGMTLYFDIEIQAKGIVRMTFEKIA